MRILPFLSSLLICLTILYSCSSESSNDSNETDIENPATLPGKPVGILPINAETCSDFEEVPGETDKAIIYFSWSVADNASSYVMEVFESGSKVNTSTVGTTSTKLTLDKGKSYSWTVTAINQDGENTSNTFSFITPGQPISNFAPYAAEISVDFDSANHEMTITWVGSDEDNDPLTYDVIIMENGITLEQYEDLTESGIAPISVSINATYTIKVTSKDNFGNFSVSTQSIILDN
jgi:hypothetical protein